MARLELTGERTAPGWPHEGYWFARHEAVYRWIVTHVTQVLDVGSGEGYGPAFLQGAGIHTVAVELDPTCCVHAQAEYPYVPIVQANAVSLPFADDAIETVCSFQTIEHLWDVHRFLDELHRVARRNVVVSTPNRPMFSPGLPRHAKPTNPFHVEEFDAEQLHALMAPWAEVDISGLHHGSRIRTWEQRHGSLVPQLVEAAVTEDWPHALLDLQGSLTFADFVITEDAHDAQDLIAWARIR